MSDIRNDKPSGKLFLPPLFRFLVELTTWLWLLIASFSNLIFLFLLLLSLVLLSQLNVLGDKKPHGIIIPGWIRIIIELFSGFLGILGALTVIGTEGAIIQLILTLVALYLDHERFKWFINFRPDPPDYVLVLGHYNQN